MMRVCMCVGVCNVCVVCVHEVSQCVCVCVPPDRNDLKLGTIVVFDTL